MVLATKKVKMGSRLKSSVARVSSSKAPSIFDQRQARIVSRAAGRGSINQALQRALTCFGPRFLTTGYPSLQYRRECVATSLLFRDRSAVAETRSARLLRVPLFARPHHCYSPPSPGQPLLEV